MSKHEARIEELELALAETERRYREERDSKMKFQEENKQLRDLIEHAWIHASYDNSGWFHMTSEQKCLFTRVACEEMVSDLSDISEG